MIEDRIISDEKKSFRFKYEHKPGLIKYFTINLGKRYKIVSDTKKISGAVVDVLAFIYRKEDDVETTTPIGVQVKFLRNNNLGTYYDMFELVEIE